MKAVIRIFCVFAMIVGFVTYMFYANYGIVTMTMAFALLLGCEVTFELHEIERTQHYRK